jgi:hypothetical protein
MIENITILIGRCPENNWRRENLLKVHNCMDKEDHFEVSFQYVEHAHNGVKQVTLTYQILK